MAFFVVILKLQIFHYDFKICEAEVTLTPLITKICKPNCNAVQQNLQC